MFFLRAKHSPVLHTTDALEHCLDPSMTEWERGRERDEFARAAQLYVSSHSTLSSRFTHAKEEDDSDQVEVPRDQEVCCHHVSTWCILKLKHCMANYFKILSEKIKIYMAL